MSIIVLRALSPMAKKHGLYVSAVKVNDNLFITGQGIMPNDPSSTSNLTLDEMTGRKPLTEEKATKFPFIIDPFIPYNFTDGYKFNSDNYEHRAQLELVKLCSMRLAKSKKEVVKGQHDFYLENKEDESADFVSKFDLVIQAGSLVLNANEEKIFDTITFLKIYKNDYSLSTAMSSLQAKAELRKYSQSEPETIIKAFDSKSEDMIIVAKIIDRGVLKINAGDFYEGNTFVAKTFDEVVNLYKQNPMVASRWLKKLKGNFTLEETQSPKSVFVSDEDNEILTDISKFKEDYLDANIDGIRVFYDKYKMSKDKVVLEFMLKHRETIKFVLKEIKPVVPKEFPKEDLKEGIKTQTI